MRASAVHLARTTVIYLSYTAEHWYGMTKSREAPEGRAIPLSLCYHALALRKR